MISIWGIFAGIAYATYESAWRDTYLFATDVSLLLEQEIARDIEHYDLSLVALSQNAADPAIMRLPPAIRDRTLFDQSANARGLGAMRLVDKDGNVIVSSIKDPTADLNIADRAFFVAARDGTTTTTQPYVSYPIESTSTNEALITFSRARVPLHGAFNGIVSGTMKVDYLNALFASVPLPPGGAISLMHRDGTIMARGMFAGVRGKVQKGPFFRAALEGQQTAPIVYKSTVDQLERLGSYHQVGQLPIYVLVGLSTAEFLGTWRFRIEIVGLGFLVLSMIILFLGVMLARELNRRVAAERTLSELAATDGLTRLANRRRFDEVLGLEWGRATRDSTCLSLLMIDCDCFKAFNDTYGHIDGDHALQLVADAFRQALRRPGDFVARFGGEEFVILLPNTNPAGANEVAEAIRHAIHTLAMPHRGSPLGMLTISVGVTSRTPQPNESAGDFVAVADAALYVAKAEGRDRIVQQILPIARAA